MAHVEFMKMRPDAEHLAADLARSVAGALEVCERYPAVLRRIAEDEYDWKPIAANLARTLRATTGTGVVLHGVLDEGSRGRLQYEDCERRTVSDQ